MSGLGYGDMMVFKPSWVNYGRVVCDIIAVCCLIAVQTVMNDTSITSRALDFRYMPTYVKTDLPFGETLTEAGTNVGTWNTKSDLICNSTTHSACGCFDTKSDMDGMKQCLVDSDINSKYSDWNTAIGPTVLWIWFLASLAASVGTLPFVNRFPAFKDTDNGVIQPPTNRHWTVVKTAYVLTVSAIFWAPIIANSAQWQKGADGSLAYLYTLSACSLVFMLAVNRHTFFSYLTHGLDNETTAHQDKSTNWIVYTHLLVAAPAMAMVLHMSQEWMEYHMILNTTAVLCIIFAVDGFSIAMVDFWARRNETAPSEPGSDLHKNMGLLRLFAWLIVGVLMLLLFVIPYPTMQNQHAMHSALFISFIIILAVAFLAPDLIREFTDIISFNSIQFRMYGDFVLRLVTLFFVWRGVAVAQT